VRADRNARAPAPGGTNSVAQANGAIQLTVAGPGGERTLEGSHVLVSVGRTPNSDSLNVAAAGIEVKPNGLIPDTGQILGCTVFGIEGGELMSMLEIAMLGKVPYGALRDAIYAHPTLAEAFNNLFAKLDS
jgi:pyruvate/2-oxoglutarate dehydrogenase complex dihydrolipoamide dehydrogenase (E3) component